MPKISLDAFIHPMAITDDTIVLGPHTRVWGFATVIRGATLGAGCNVTSGTVIDGSVFGDRCTIQNHCAIGPGFKVGNDVFIGPNVSFCHDMWPASSKQNYDIEALRSGKKWAIIVENRAFIGANAAILPGVTIGADAGVAAGAVVDRDVPPNHLFCRDGSMREIKAAWRERRMRFAS